MDVYPGQPQSMTRSCSTSTHIIGIVVSLLIGVVVGVVADPYLPAPLSNTQKGYQSGFTAAQDLIKNSSFGKVFEAPADVRIVTGTVTAIQGNTLELKANINPLDDPALAHRTLLLSASTTVLKITQTGFPTSVATSTKIAVAPFKATPVKIADIKVGDTISALSSVNIKSLSEFPVITVQIMSTAATKTTP